MILPKKNFKYFRNNPRFIFSKNLPKKLGKEEVLEHNDNKFHNLCTWDVLENVF